MPPGLVSTLSATVRQLCRTHLDDPTFGLGRMASTLGISERHVRRRLVAETGEGPQALLRRLRIERAERLLAEGAAVESVARQVGYCDVSAFRRAFRAVTGRTPGTHS